MYDACIQYWHTCTSHVVIYSVWRWNNFYVGPKAMSCCSKRKYACICHEHALNHFMGLPDPESNAVNSLKMLTAQTLRLRLTKSYFHKKKTTVTSEVMHVLRPRKVGPMFDPCQAWILTLQAQESRLNSSLMLNICRLFCTSLIYTLEADIVQMKASMPPKLQHLILPPWSNWCPVWAPVNSEHLISMPRQVTLNLLGMHIPDLHKQSSSSKCLMLTATWEFVPCLQVCHVSRLS